MQTAEAEPKQDLSKQWTQAMKIFAYRRNWAGFQQWFLETKGGTVEHERNFYTTCHEYLHNVLENGCNDQDVYGKAKYDRIVVGYKMAKALVDNTTIVSDVFGSISKVVYHSRKCYYHGSRQCYDILLGRISQDEFNLGSHVCCLLALADTRIPGFRSGIWRTVSAPQIKALVTYLYDGGRANIHVLAEFLEAIAKIRFSSTLLLPCPSEFDEIVCKWFGHQWMDSQCLHDFSAVTMLFSDIVSLEQFGRIMPWMECLERAGLEHQYVASLLRICIKDVVPLDIQIRIIKTFLPIDIDVCMSYMNGNWPLLRGTWDWTWDNTGVDYPDSMFVNICQTIALGASESEIFLFVTLPGFSDRTTNLPFAIQPQDRSMIGAYLFRVLALRGFIRSLKVILQWNIDYSIADENGTGLLRAMALLGADGVPNAKGSPEYTAVGLVHGTIEPEALAQSAWLEPKVDNYIHMKYINLSDFMEMLCCQVVEKGALRYFEFLEAAESFSKLDHLCSLLVMHWLTTKTEATFPILLAMLRTVPAYERATWPYKAIQQTSSPLIIEACLGLVDKPWESSILGDHLAFLARTHNIEAVRVMTEGLVNVRAALTWAVPTGPRKDSIYPNPVIVHLLETAGAFPPGVYNETFPGGCFYLAAKQANWE